MKYWKLNHTNQMLILLFFLLIVVYFLMRYSRVREGLGNSEIVYEMTMGTENREIKLGDSVKFIYDESGGTYPTSHPLMMDATSNYSGGKKVDDEFSSISGNYGEWKDLTQDGKLTYTFTPTEAKTYYWYCKKHSWMKGKIIVTSGGGGGGGGGNTSYCSRKKKNIKTRSKWKKLCLVTQKHLCKSAKKKNKFKKKYCKGKKSKKNKYLCKLLKKNGKKSLCK
jgi:plastocyanin